MDEQSKSRIRELMFHAVPDPDEIIDDDVLERTEAVGYEEGQTLKAEFRSLIESLVDWPDARQTVLESLDTIEDSGNDVPGDAVEWKNVCDVMGRKIRRVLAEVLSAE
jgi:hypothetical protein